MQCPPRAICLTLAKQAKCQLQSLYREQRKALKSSRAMVSMVPCAPHLDGSAVCKAIGDGMRVAHAHARHQPLTAIHLEPLLHNCLSL